jgi:tetratricopeptide (TPR) repeat protein
MSVDLMLGRAVSAHRAGNFAAAERGYHSVARFKPLEANNNLGALFTTLGRFPDAERAYRAALAADPASPDARHGLARLLLSDGRYPEGWSLYEGRRGVPSLQINVPQLPCPEWMGEPLSGKRLLVIGEQGFGDQIMFARFLEPLRTMGGEVTYCCAPDLAPLFPGAVPARQWSLLPEADCWVLIGSLPGRLGMTLNALPPPYTPPVTLGQGGGVGVRASGRPSHANDAHRSLGRKEAAKLLALGTDLAPESTGAKDFRETAEIVAKLDLVITVDTAVAHLAASMGKPTWILLPARDTDWRWLHNRTDSPWYPSARLFRQAAPGRWPDVLREVAAALAAWRPEG